MLGRDRDYPGKEDGLEPPKFAVIYYNGVRKTFWYRDGEEVSMPPYYEELDLGDDEDEPES